MGWLDIPFTIISLVVLAIFLLIMHYVWDDISSHLDELVSSSTAQQVIATSDIFWTASDYLFVFIAIGFPLASIVLAYLGRFNPIYFVVSLILIAINLVVSPIFANVMLEMFSNVDFLGYQVDYPMMTFIFQYYPHYTTVISFLLSLAMYASGRDERM